MKTNSVISLVGSIALLLAFSFSCKKEPTQIITETEDVPLTDAQAAFLETVKDTTIRLEDVILEDGQNVRTFLETYDPDFLNKYHKKSGNTTADFNPLQQRSLFISRMVAIGEFLVDDPIHNHPFVDANKPAQTRLAYSWGSKDWDIRQIPPGVTGECKDLAIYGLDCSGMIWAMTKASSLPPVVPKYNFCVKQITEAPKWTAAFKASTDYKDLKMRDMGQIPEAKMENGDIILWGSHVGIYLYGYFYQSNGTSKLPGCNNNLSMNRGPRLIDLSEVLKWGLGSYKVFRVDFGALVGEIDVLSDGWEPGMGWHTVEHTHAQVRWIKDPVNDYYVSQGSYTYEYTWTIKSEYINCVENHTAAGSIDGTGILTMVDDPAIQNAIGYSYNAVSAMFQVNSKIETTCPGVGEPTSYIYWCPDGRVRGFPGSGGTYNGEMTYTDTINQSTMKIKWSFISIPD